MRPLSSCNLTIHHSYDNNQKLGGTSFKARYADWAKDPMVDDFSRWTAESFGEFISLEQKCANATLF